MELIQHAKYYEDPETGERMIRATKPPDLLAKPGLIIWSANEARRQAKEAAADFYQEMPTNGTKLSRESYLATLEQRIGKTKAHEKLLQKAIEIGKQAHGLIEWHLRGELKEEVGPEPHVSDKALWAFMAWQDWRKKVNLAPIAIEQQVWSRRHRYAGTMDLYCEMDIEGEGRRRAVVDWKTASGLRAEHRLQNAAYVKAWEEMGQAEPPTWGCIVRLPKVETDPEFETKLIRPEEHDELFGIFLHLLKVWPWWNAEEEASYKRWKAEQAKKKKKA